MTGAFYESQGTSVARPPSVVRRVTAFVAMVAIVIIVLAVMWSVYQHRRNRIPRDEPTIVELPATSAGRLNA